MLPLNMRGPVLLLLLACAPLGAEVPQGPAPARPIRQERGFTLNAEVLARYGYTLDRYNALAPGERQRVAEWIEVLEVERLAAQAYAPKPPEAPQPKLELKPAEIQSLSQLGRKDLFGPGVAAPEAGPLAWGQGLKVTNGEMDRFTLRHEASDFQLSFGQLGAGGRSPLLGRSPYLSLEKGGSGSGSRLDYGYKLQAGVVDLNARLFYDDAPGLDRRIDQGLSLVGDPALTRSLSVSTDFTGQKLFLGSALGHVGRAYNLFGPVDFAWSAMGAMRWTGAFPNASLDQSAGLRVKTAPDHNVGVFGGATEAIGLFSRSIVADSVSSGKVDVKPELDVAPHVTVAAWGKMPYLSSVQYSLEAGRQWNPWTTVQSAAGSLSAPAGKEGRVGVFGSYSDESGEGAEFRRRKSEGGVSYSPNAQVDLWGSYGRDHARLGNAEVSNQQVLFGLTIREKAPKSYASATVESVFASPDRLIVPEAQASSFVRTLNEHLAELQRLKDLGDALAGPGGAAARWDEVRGEYWKLDPALRRAFNDAYDRYGPGGGSLDGIFSKTGADARDYARAFELLGDARVLDRILTRAIRAQLLENIEKVEIPLFGNKYKLSAPMVLAAAHAYGLGLRPLPAVTAKDARESFDPAIFKELSGKLGCSASDAAAVTDCVLGKLPPAEADELRRRYGSDLTALMKETVSWASDVLRRELNSLMLQVYMAADRLNELTADRGKRLGELNDRALKGSFARLDERRRKTNAEVFKLGARLEREDLAKRDAELAARVTDYGRRRLAWLQAEAAWPKNVSVAVRAQDWAPLLAIYGDAGLFDIVLQAKAKAEARGGGRVIIELDPNPAFGGLSVVTGDPMLIRLPPRAPRSGKVILP